MSKDRCTKGARKRTQYEEMKLSDEVCRLENTVPREGTTMRCSLGEAFPLRRWC